MQYDIILVSVHVHLSGVARRRKEYLLLLFQYEIKLDIMT